MAKLITPVFRVSFPSLFAARSMNDDGSNPKFGLSAIWEPERFSPAEKRQWAAILAAVDEAGMQKFKKKLADFPGNFKRPFRDGAEKAELAGYGPGKLFASITSKLKPGVVGIDGQPILEASEIYPGCYARASITVYPYDNKSKGVAFGLQNVQKIKDGDRLDSRTDANEDFGGEGVDDRWLEGDVDPLA